VRSNNPLWLAALGLVLAFGVWRLFDLRFAHGDVYPPYSSLRADQFGSRALFDSIGGVPGFAVSRNFRPLEKIPAGARTVFYLGVSPNNFEYQPEEAFEELEKLAADGARVVIGFRSVPAERKPKRELIAPVEKRWGVRFTFANPVDPAEASQTALSFEPEGQAWQGNAAMLERGFGRGSVLLLARSYPLSNEGLQRERATGLIAHMLGGNRQVVFDESHLGEVESGSVAGLARNYHLEGLAAALLALAGLYLWKNSVSFLPPRETEQDEILTSAKDASSGLANLLRRNIPAAELIRTCVAQWEKDRGGARYAAAKVERVRAIANRGGDPAAAYAEIGRILK
jgi:hypothetical protein